MSILAAIAVPHPPLILPEVGRGEERDIQSTIDSFRQAAAFLAARRPATVVIISPHATMFADWFEISPGARARGSFARFGAPGLAFTAHYDEALAADIARLAEEQGLPAGDSGRGDPALDHGTMIPLYFLQQVLPQFQIVRMGISGLPLDAHYRLGQCIAAASGDKPVAIVASGDLSHRLKEDGPYGFRPEGPQLDKQITDGLARGDFAALRAIDPRLAEGGAECGLRSFVMMGGALAGQPVQANLLSYEGPFGVGYAVATFSTEPTAEQPTHAATGCNVTLPGCDVTSPDPYIALAKLSLTTYVTTGRRAQLPPGLPSELTQRRAGVFVSLHAGGELRGCIGTFAPTTASVAEEILQNAVSAATEDPRFPPVRASEIPTLDVSVDVLGDTEPVHSPDELDPKRYGVIVSSGHRRGLLLPDLDGVDTVQQQIDIARRKAGIPAGASVTLQRFEVVRHEQAT